MWTRRYVRGQRPPRPLAPRHLRQDRGLARPLRPALCSRDTAAHAGPSKSFGYVASGASYPRTADQLWRLTQRAPSAKATLIVLRGSCKEARRSGDGRESEPSVAAHAGSVASWQAWRAPETWAPRNGTALIACPIPRPRRSECVLRNITVAPVPNAPEAEVARTTPSPSRAANSRIAAGNERRCLASTWARIVDRGSGANPTH